VRPVSEPAAAGQQAQQEPRVPKPQAPPQREPEASRQESVPPAVERNPQERSVPPVLLDQRQREQVQAEPALGAQLWLRLL
jgi:hypothetical protein